MTNRSTQHLNFLRRSRKSQPEPSTATLEFLKNFARAYVPELENSNRLHAIPSN
jgi:hypothetical protein